MNGINKEALEIIQQFRFLVYWGSFPSTFLIALSNF